MLLFPFAFGASHLCLDVNGLNSDRIFKFIHDFRPTILAATPRTIKMMIESERASPEMLSPLRYRIVLCGCDFLFNPRNFTLHQEHCAHTQGGRPTFCICTHTHTLTRHPQAYNTATHFRYTDYAHCTHAQTPHTHITHTHTRQHTYAHIHTHAHTPRWPW